MHCTFWNGWQRKKATRSKTMFRQRLLMLRPVRLKILKTKPDSRAASQTTPYRSQKRVSTKGWTHQTKNQIQRTEYVDANGYGCKSRPHPHVKHNGKAVSFHPSYSKALTTCTFHSLLLTRSPINKSRRAPLLPGIDRGTDLPKGYYRKKKN